MKQYLTSIEKNSGPNWRAYADKCNPHCFGFLTASVAFLIASVVVLLLKVMGEKMLRDDLFRAVEDTARNLTNVEVNINHKVDDIYQTITDRSDEALRSIDSKCASVLKGADRYTDSRFDRMLSIKK